MKMFLFFFNMLFNGGLRTAIGSKHRSKINILVTMSDNIFPQTNGCFVLVIAVYNHKFRFICVYHHSMSVTVIIQNTQFLKELISTCCENYRNIHKHQDMQPVQNPSLPYLSLNTVISVSTNKLNKKHDVGDPCLTPIIAVTMAIPRMLFVTLYMAAMANNIIKPHPKRFIVCSSLFLGTRSYAFEKST